MRKINKFLIIIAISCFALPYNIKAVTLGEYESKLAQYEKELANSQAAINKTETEIKQAQIAIENIKKEMINMADEIKKMIEETEYYNEEIKEKNKQTKELYQHLQITNGKDIYMEYAFGSDTIADFIYRISIVEQLTNHNDKAVAELEELIKANQKREKDIENRRVELNKKENQLYSKIETLGHDKSQYQENGISASEQVKIYREIVAGYKKQGCKSTDTIGVDCAVANDAGIFRRPTQTGYLTQFWGYRGSYLHRGVDIGSSKKTKEKIYPVANGTITAKYIDGWGALVIIMEHYHSATGQWYTSMYGHMDSFAPNLYVGKKLTSSDYLGYMGNTGYSFGVHLHLEVVPCRLNDMYDKNCKNWTSYTNYQSELAKKGYKGPSAVINFPSKLYSSWSTR